MTSAARFLAAQWLRTALASTSAPVLKGKLLMQVAVFAADLAAHLALPAYHRYRLQPGPSLGGPFEVRRHSHDPVFALLNTTMTAWASGFKIMAVGLFGKTIGKTLLKP